MLILLSEEESLPEIGKDSISSIILSLSSYLSSTAALNIFIDLAVLIDSISTNL